MTPQFFYLYPSLLAVANAIGGLPLSFYVNARRDALAATVLALAVRQRAHHRPTRGEGAPGLGRPSTRRLRSSP